jgi:hypothetical protein
MTTEIQKKIIEEKIDDNTTCFILYEEKPCSEDEIITYGVQFKKREIRKAYLTKENFLDDNKKYYFRTSHNFGIYLKKENALKYINEFLTKNK